LNFQEIEGKDREKKGVGNFFSGKHAAVKDQIYWEGTRLETIGGERWKGSILNKMLRRTKKLPGILQDGGHQIEGRVEIGH